MKKVAPVCLSKNRHPSFIGAYMLSDSTVCDDLINFMDDLEGLATGKVYEGVVASVEEKTVVDKSSKDCMQKNLHWDDSVFLDYNAELQKCLDAYLQEFKAANDVPVLLWVLALAKYRDTQREGLIILGMLKGGLQ